jgi:hypothetical protein
MKALNGQSRAVLVTTGPTATSGWPVPEWKVGGQAGPPAPYPPPFCPGAEGGKAYPPQVLNLLSRSQWLQSTQWPQ